MSSSILGITQQQLNGLSYEETHELLWMITFAGKAQDVDWGYALDPAVKSHVKNFCKAVGQKYDKDVAGPDMLAQAASAAIIDHNTPEESEDESEADQAPEEPKAPTKKPKQPKEPKEPKGPTKKDLQAECKTLGIKGFSDKNKDELLTMIAAHKAAPAEEPEPEDEPIEDEPIEVTFGDVDEPDEAPEDPEDPEESEDEYE